MRYVYARVLWWLLIFPGVFFAIRFVRRLAWFEYRTFPLRTYSGYTPSRDMHVHWDRKLIRITLLAAGLLLSTFLFGEGMAQDNPNLYNYLSCPIGRELDPYKIWESVQSDDDAKKFLKDNYARFGNVDDFAQWLACQEGLKIRLWNGEDYTVNPTPGRIPYMTVIMVYGTSKKGFLWPPRNIGLRLVAHGVSVNMFIDKAGEMYETKIGYSSK